MTLHVGLDTFRPVQGEDPTQHHIHTEYYEVSGEAAGSINRARREGRRIVAVGTTSVRVLEQAALRMEESGQGELTAVQDQAELFILPGHRFRMVDAMVTNFHLPSVHAADAGVGLRRKGNDAPGLPGGNTGRIPVLLVRRRDADSVN